MLIEQIKIKAQENNQYPFNLPLFKEDLVLDVNSPVTIVVGDNGCGKSSLLKILQSKLNLVKIKLPDDNETQKLKYNSVTLSPSLSKLKGFFFESLKFINYIEYIQKEIAYSESEIKRIDEEYKNRSDYAKMMAKSPSNKTIYELKNMYEKDLSKSSHGESYLDFFSSRLRDNQVYLLDEPETPLSVQNQLTLLALILDATKNGCQFIIATHSPILSAIPNALIYEVIDNEFVKTDYDDIKSIQLLKQFVNNKEQFLRYFE